MKTTKPMTPTQTTTVVIGGKKVTVATPGVVKQSAGRLKGEYSKALEILKNR